MNLKECIEESLRIEGINRPATKEECDEHRRFLAVPTLTVREVEAFVRVYQPNAKLRITTGMDVRVGGHVPPKGGAEVLRQFNFLLESINSGALNPWQAHVAYERLHPFTDGNGRSGRMLWYWMMRESTNSRLGFLHAFYYQTLAQADRQDGKGVRHAVGY